MTRVKALALEDEGRRNAPTLVKLETDPPRYLNSVYLSVMIVQNGSAILVAILAERQFDSLGVTLASLVFTLLYFVFVEAMSKTFGVLHSDRVAPRSPLVYLLGRLLAWPTRALIGLSNVLLPGKGIKAGPFVSEEEIRSMVQVGSEEGSIDEGEKELIHSIFEFGDTIVREVMVPRPDIVAIENDKALRDVQALVLTHGVPYPRLRRRRRHRRCDRHRVRQGRAQGAAPRQARHAADRHRARGISFPSRRRSPICCARCSARSSTWRS